MSNNNTPLFKLLEGRTVSVMTDVGAKVPLEVKSVKKIKRTIEEPDTPQNGFWGQTYDVIEYVVRFKNGHEKTYKDVSDLEIVNTYKEDIK